MVKPSSGKQQEQNEQSIDCRFKGVRMRKWGKWVAEVRLPHSRQRIWLGSYDAPEKAARAFDAAVYCLRGPSARLNFPENPPEIPSAGGKMTPAEIQATARRFAHMSPPDNAAAVTTTAAAESSSASSVSDFRAEGTSSSASWLDVTTAASAFDDFPAESFFPAAEAVERVIDEEEEDEHSACGEFYQPRLWNF